MDAVQSSEKLTEIARTIRFEVIELCARARTPHLGSALSCIDLLVAAYWHALNVTTDNVSAPDRDRFILSKGHAGVALYVALAHKGIIPHSELEQYSVPGTIYAEHPLANAVPGVEVATGSLGHGLSVGLGMALASKVQKLPYEVLVLLSDGECNEGSVWEAVMTAPALKTSNLTAIVDYNKWQATGRSNEVLALEPLVDKWSSFGWHAVEVDGHDMDQICSHLTKAKQHTDAPSVLIAHTTKGKGVSFMEDDNNWHYRIPTEEEVAAAKTELGL